MSEKKATIPESWVVDILTGEDSGIRFEEFAVAITGALENQPIVRTSRSWDRGRDGRPARPGRNVITLSTTEDNPSKPAKDAKRLNETTSNVSLVYCFSSQTLSEHKADQFNAAIRDAFPHGSTPQIRTNDARQIAQLVCSDPRCEDAFREYYTADIATWRRHYEPTSSESAEALQFHLALGTFASDDCQEVRDEIGRRIVISLLSEGAASIAEVSRRSEHKFKLGAVAESTLRKTIEYLTVSGDVEEAGGGHYQLTAKGEQTLEEHRKDQATSGLTGAHALRRVVESSLGNAVTESQWQRIWSHFQSELASVFHVKGHELVSVVNSLISEEVAPKERTDLAALLDRGIERTAQVAATGPQRTQVAQALHDALLPGSEAFDWLLSTAAVYTSTCTLGLSSDVFRAVADLLASVRIFFDTDVVITYLCPHEPNHEAAKSARQISKTFQRQVFVTNSAAEEVARHAMKAHVDYMDQVRDAARPLKWFELETLKSAFTREFEHMRIEGVVVQSEWGRYIKSYTGDFRVSTGRRLVPNTAKMRQILSAEGFLVLGDEGVRDAQTVHNLTTILHDLRRKRPRRKRLTGIDIVEDEWDDDDDGNDYNFVQEEKARLDAELLLSVAHEVDQSEHRGRGERFILVSNAWVMRHLPASVLDIIGRKFEVLTMAEIAYLAALLPNSPVKLGALRSMLFDSQFSSLVKPLERKLLTILRRSKKASFPGASRGLLLSEFGDLVLQHAKISGQSQRATRKRILADPELFGRLAAAAVDAHGVIDKQERAEALGEISKLAESLNGSTEVQ